MEFSRRNIVPLAGIAALVGVAPAKAQTSSKQIFSSFNDRGSDVFYNPYPMYLFNTFQIAGPSLLDVDVHALFVHQAIPNSAGKDDYPIGVGCMIGMRGPYADKSLVPTYGAPVEWTAAERQANPPTWIARTGQNIFGATDHYYSCTLTKKKTLSQPGWYSVEGWSFAQTDSTGLENQSGLVKLCIDRQFGQQLVRMEGSVEPI